MNKYIASLEVEFKNNQNPKIASGQKAYMRNQFEFFGIKAPIRREIQQPFLEKKYLPKKEILNQLIQELWQKPEREFQLFSQELVFKFSKAFEKEDIKLLEYMVTNKSWWDTVDFIATQLIGPYFKIHTENRLEYINKWLASENIWLQRCAILFQLKYKEELDTELLTHTIVNLLGSKEFFINKAIGWILREYSKTNPPWVIDFTRKTELNSLSRREALRLIK